MNMMRVQDSTSYDFPVELQEIYVRHPDSAPMSEGVYYEAPRSLAQAVVRTDTGDVLAVHGGSYRITKHADVIENIEKMLQQSELAGEKIVREISTYDRGAKLRAYYKFPELVAEPVVNDIVAFGLEVLNSYDGQWAFNLAGIPERLWCLNGCTDATYSVRFRRKHTTTFNVEAMLGSIKNQIELFQGADGVWKQYYDTPAPTSDVERFFRKTVCHAPSLNDPNKVNGARLENLLGRWAYNRSGSGSNMWSLYNTLTEWATHPEAKVKRPHIATEQRRGLIADAMRSKEWDNMLNQVEVYEDA